MHTISGNVSYTEDLKAFLGSSIDVHRKKLNMNNEILILEENPSCGESEDQSFLMFGETFGNNASKEHQGLTQSDASSLYILKDNMKFLNDISSIDPSGNSVA